MISREKMISLYSAMVKYRALAETLAQQGMLADSLLTPGREAAMAAITADLRTDDTFVATQSRLASTLIAGPKRNAPIQLAATNGHVRNANDAVARDFAAAVETAAVLNRAKGNAIAVVFCESRIKADLWNKQLKKAGRNNLPVILVRLRKEATSKSPRRASAAPSALAFGVPSIAVDADDVLAVYRVASESIARARHRRGPTLIDCVDFSHPNADVIHAMEKVLVRKRILSAALKQKVAITTNRDVKDTLRRSAN